MKRRRFILAAGSGILTGSIGLSQSQRPAVGLSFELANIPDEDPNNVNKLAINFSKLELTPQYMDDSDDMTVTAKVEVDGYGSDESRAVSVPVVNGRTERIASTINTMVVDNIGDEDNIFGTVTVTVEHPDVEDSYYRGFNISKSESSGIPNRLFGLTHDYILDYDVFTFNTNSNQLNSDIYSVEPSGSSYSIESIWTEGLNAYLGYKARPDNTTFGMIKRVNLDPVNVVQTQEYRDLDRISKVIRVNDQLVAIDLNGKLQQIDPTNLDPIGSPIDLPVSEVRNVKKHQNNLIICGYGKVTKVDPESVTEIASYTEQAGRIEFAATSNGYLFTGAGFAGEGDIHKINMSTMEQSDTLVFPGDARFVEIKDLVATDDYLFVIESTTVDQVNIPSMEFGTSELFDELPKSMAIDEGNLFVIIDNGDSFGSEGSKIVELDVESLDKDIVYSNGSWSTADDLVDY